MFDSELLQAAIGHPFVFVGQLCVGDLGPVPGVLLSRTVVLTSRKWIKDV